MTLSDIYVKEQLHAYKQCELKRKDHCGVLRYYADIARDRTPWWSRLSQTLQSALHLFHNRSNKSNDASHGQRSSKGNDNQPTRRIKKHAATGSDE